MQTEEKINSALIILLDPRCLLYNTTEDLSLVSDNLVEFCSNYTNSKTYSDKSLFALRDLGQHKINDYITNNPDIFLNLEACEVLEIKPNNFLSYKSIESFTPSTTRKISYFDHSDLNQEEIKRCSEISNLIENQLNNLKNKELSGNLEERLYTLVSLFNFCKSFTLGYIYNTNSENELFIIKYKIFIKIFAELSIIKFNDRDFVNGWLDLHEKEVDPIISTPFILAAFDKNQKSSISNLSFLPSQHVLNNFKSSFCFIEQDNIASDTQTKPTLMVNTPDRFGIKYLNRLKLSSIEILLDKVFYFNSGLTYQGNVPCSQFSLHFWLNEKTTLNPENLKNSRIHLDVFHSVESSSEFFNIRYLTDMGGSTDEIFCVDKIDKVKTSNIAGGLKGIRCIDSSNNKIIDYRFQKLLKSIEVTKIKNTNNISLCKIRFEISLDTLKNFENSNSLTFSTY